MLPILKIIVFKIVFCLLSHKNVLEDMKVSCSLFSESNILVDIQTRKKQHAARDRSTFRLLLFFLPNTSLVVIMVFFSTTPEITIPARVKYQNSKTRYLIKSQLK